MHFKELILDLVSKRNISMFVDMDGVIASYEINKPYEFDKKRPLFNNIKIFEEVSKIPGVNLYILSVCREDNQIKDKNDWLDKYAPFFKRENRNILSKETIINETSANMKLNFLRDFVCDDQIVLVDDDNLVLKTIKNNLNKVIVFQDSELVD